VTDELRADRGLQAERTALAHVRTWLGVLLAAMLLARQGGRFEAVAIAAGAAGVVVAGVASAARVRRITAGELTAVASARRTLMVLVAAVAAMQVAAVVTIL
jgi:hypothetical protein